FIFDGTSFTVPTQGVKNNYVQDNTISGNRGNGVLIDGIRADNNLVYGNTIDNNTGNGVQISGGAQENQIGGTGPGQTNLIHDNGGAGILFRNLGFDFNLYPGQDFYTANSPDSPTATSIVPVTANA